MEKSRYLESAVKEEKRQEKRGLREERMGGREREKKKGDKE